MKLSVIIPAYNEDRLIASLLDKVIEAKLPEGMDKEILVINDGSTDGTPALLESLARQHQDLAPRVRVHRQENQGIGPARNACLERAEGNVIAFLDADDLWTDDSLENRAALLEADPTLDGAVGIVEQFLSPDIPPELKNQYVTPPDARVGRMAGSMLLRRRAFDMAGLFDPDVTMGDTMDWVLRAESAGVTLGSVEKLVLRRRIHGTNFTVQNQGDQAGYLKVLKAHLDRQRAQASKDQDG
jgi:glycosyltransferase involved in cell wall biosynthesis